MDRLPGCTAEALVAGVFCFSFSLLLQKGNRVCTALFTFLSRLWSGSGSVSVDSLELEETWPRAQSSSRAGKGAFNRCLEVLGC